MIKNIEKVTERIDVISALEVAMYSYCRQNLEQNNDESGVIVFDSKAPKKEMPFRVFFLVNLSQNPLKLKLGVKFNTGNISVYITTELQVNLIPQL